MFVENLPKGLKGTIKKIDDIGQIHVSWENGSSLAINPKIDKFEVKKAEENKQDKKISLQARIDEKKEILNKNKQEKLINVENNQTRNNTIS